MGIAAAGAFGLNRASHHGSCQLIQQRLRLLQDRRVEAFGEPAIDRREQIMCLGPPALVTPEPGEAGRGSQLEKLRALLFGNGNGLTVMLLGPGPVRLRNIVGIRWGMLLPPMATCLTV